MTPAGGTPSTADIGVGIAARGGGGASGGGCGTAAGGTAAVANNNHRLAIGVTGFYRSPFQVSSSSITFFRSRLTGSVSNQSPGFRPLLIFLGLGNHDDQCDQHQKCQRQTHFNL